MTLQTEPITRARHILSVDVEDYFQVEAFAGSISRESWDSWPSRVVGNTQRVLDLFDEYGAKATFFFVGWVAQRFPHLVREVQARGHELACHSFWHRTIYSLSREEFLEDTQAARSTIEQAAGVTVLGYRAPSWSITKDCLWALDVLAECGFVYDSSIYPVHHDLYGVPDAQRFPYEHSLAGGLKLKELPPTTVRLPGVNLLRPAGGISEYSPRPTRVGCLPCTRGSTTNLWWCTSTRGRSIRTSPEFATSSGRGCATTPVCAACTSACAGCCGSIVFSRSATPSAFFPRPGRVPCKPTLWT